MSFSVTNAHVQAFTSSVHHALQQQAARFMDSCRIEYDVVGESYRFDILSDSEMVPGVRHGDTQYANDAHSTSTAYLKPFEKAHLVDKMDKAQTLINLENDYSKNIAYSYYRRLDQTILEEGIFPTSTTAIAADTNNGLSFDQVNACREYADGYEWPEEDRFFGYTEASLTTLLDQTQVGSSDYNTIKTLISGKMDPSAMWMGFKWRRMPARVLTANSKRTGAVGSVTGETNYFWHKSGVGLAIAQSYGSLNVRMSVEGTKRYSVQVYADAMLGATVIEDELVVPVTIDYAG